MQELCKSGFGMEPLAALPIHGGSSHLTSVFMCFHWSLGVGLVVLFSPEKFHET
jgi:hypothetical protein